MARNHQRPNWDRPLPTPRREAKIKNLPEEEQETLWLLRHPTDAETPPATIEECLVHLASDHSIECSVSTFWEWERWYTLRLRYAAAEEAALQAKQERLAADPAVSLAELERLGQIIFTNESIETKNGKLYVGLKKLRLQETALENDSRRVALLEANAAQAKAKLEAAVAGAQSAGGLTPETLMQIEEAAKLL